MNNFIRQSQTSTIELVTGQHRLDSIINTQFIIQVVELKNSKDTQPVYIVEYKNNRD